MPPIYPGTMAQHMQPGFRAIVGTTLDGRTTYYSQMLRVESTSRNYEDYFAATGIPMAVEKPAGVDIQAFDPLEGATKRVRPIVYAAGVEITEEAWDDDLYTGKGSAIREAAGGLGESLAERTELEAHRMFNTDGFPGGTITVLPDSLTFFNTAHTPIAGGQGITQANMPATNADFNVTSFRSALTQFRRYRTDQGYRIPQYGSPTELWVPFENEYAAKEVINSTYRPDAGNMVDNVTKGEVTVKTNAYLDDTDSWFLKAPKHFAVMLWRWRPRMDSFDDRRARVAIHVIYSRFVTFPYHWLGWYGSPGQ